MIRPPPPMGGGRLEGGVGVNHREAMGNFDDVTIGSSGGDGAAVWHSNGIIPLVWVPTLALTLQTSSRRPNNWLAEMNRASRTMLRAFVFILWNCGIVGIGGLIRLWFFWRFFCPRQPGLHHGRPGW